MQDRRTPDIADTRHRIEAYLLRTGRADRLARVVPLTGDASDRSYFRVFAPGSAPFVLALNPAPFDFATLPFANVARLLARMPVPVPAILDHQDDLGALGLEDLGDLTLQAHLGATSPAVHAELYREAVRLLVVLQQRGRELEGPEYLPYSVAFDVAKLTWELDFFGRHFIEAYRGISLPASAAQTLREEWALIVEELASEPRVLCHRDYHSRNLMWHDGRLYMIDFQDARLGPDTYDLVSLLRDSYVDLTDDLFEHVIEHFITLKGDITGASELRRRFDLMALQRNLKALGTFGYQTMTRGNPVYLQYIPRTLRYVRNNLERYPRFGRLRDALADLIPELR